MNVQVHCLIVTCPRVPDGDLTNSEDDSYHSRTCQVPHWLHGLCSESQKVVLSFLLSGLHSVLTRELYSGQAAPIPTSSKTRSSPVHDEVALERHALARALRALCLWDSALAGIGCILNSTEA